MAWFPSIRPPGGALSLVLASKIALAVLCLVLFGCASRDPTMARIFEAPNVIHVCVRPLNVPKDQRIWGLNTSDGSPFFEAPAVALARRAGRPVYIFDPEAPPESVRVLPIPYNTLECPAPPKPRVVAAKVEDKKKEPTKKAEAKKAERPKPLPAAKHCASYGEPGQTRRRSGAGSVACTRVLVKRPSTEHVVAERRPPATGPIPVPKPPTPERIESSEVPSDEGRVYDDWRLTSGEAAQLDRVRECVQGVCHSRHRNFVPKGHKETAGKHDGHALSTGSASGGGASPPRPVRTTKVKTTTKPVAKPNGKAAGQAPSTGTRTTTTVKTTKKPAAKPNDGAAGQRGSSGGKTAGSGSGTVVPEGRKLPNEELKAAPPKRGTAPTGSDGHPVELHHRGQKPDSPLDEMTRTEHRGKGNFSENHSNTGQQPSQIDRKAWKEQQRRYWTKEHDRGRFDKKQ